MHKFIYLALVGSCVLGLCACDGGNGGGSPMDQTTTYSLTPSSVIFADQLMGTASPTQSITVTNTGNSSGTITSIGISGPGAASFTQTNTCGAPLLAGGGTCTITLTFTPAVEGTQSATLTLAPTTGSSTIALSGVGFGPATLQSPGDGTTVNTNPVTFTWSPVSSAVSYTLYIGTAAGLSDVVNSGATTSTSLIEAGLPSSKTLHVRLWTQFSGTQRYSDSMLITGTLLPILTVTPSGLSFSSQTVGTTASLNQNVTLTNSGTSSLSVIGTILIGSNSTSFSQVNTCASPLAPGASCAVTVAFTPDVIGSNLATLSIATTPAFNPAPIPLSGLGLAWNGPTWTWVGGSSAGNANGVYGTKGVAAAGNVPGARYGSVSWTDTSGDRWLFGGIGEDASHADPRYLSDLWKYSSTTGQWTWVSGSSTGNTNGVYGARGVAAAGNVPGARYDSVSWTDASGNLWLFGGGGYDSATTGGLGDLWKYSPSTGLWTWAGGSNVVNSAGVYGTQGAATAGNAPGARAGSVSWTDVSGNLWLFGGSGVDSAGADGGLNDLWKYSPGSGLWTWVSGSNVMLYGGAVCGTPGVPAPGNVPGSLDHASSWIDSSGNLWLFGGEGWTGQPGIYTNFNSLWTFSPGTGLWTCSGPSNGGVYGTQGVAAAGNVPPGRARAVSWTDHSGNLWLFGGVLVANVGGANFNDLWKYSPGTGLWTWVSGSNTGNALAAYCTAMGTPAGCNVPGGRESAVSWIDGAGNLWLFGGFGLRATQLGSISAYDNDLWEYSP